MITNKYNFDPDKFILNDISIKNTRNGKYYCQDILLHGRTVTITGKVSTTIKDYIDFGFYRPKDVYPSGTSFVNRISYTEYFEDITNFFFVLAQIEPEISSIPLSLIKVCDLHICRNNRIIDSDIYTYCDEAIVVSEIVLNSSDPSFVIPDKDKIIMWHEFKEIVFKKYADFIFLTKYKRSGLFDFHLKPYLEKMI